MFLENERASLCIPSSQAARKWDEAAYFAPHFFRHAQSEEKGRVAGYVPKERNYVLVP